MKSYTILPVLLTVITVSACKKSYTQYATHVPMQTAALVTTEVAEEVEQLKPIRTTGFLSSGSEKNLSFKIGGVIDKILVDEGQYYKRGQVLARLKLDEINGQLSKAEQAYQKIERDFNRVERLYKDSAATLEQMQDVQTALEVAQADAEIARFNYQHAIIVAEEDGKVLRRFGEPGEIIGAGAPVLFVGNVNTSSFLIKAQLTDKDIIRVQEGDSAQIYFDAYPEEKFQAHVTEVGMLSDPQSGTFEVELTLAPTNRILKNGFFSSADIYARSNSRYHAIPYDAIMEANEKEIIVYLADLKAMKAKKMSLKPVQLQNDRVIVPYEEALLTDPLIVASNKNLRDRTPFTITETH
jgi:RND family efflux transporter MFP subunit